MTSSQGQSQYNQNKIQNISVIQGTETKQIEYQTPVLYVWFGNQVPEDYLISFAQLNYSIIFQKNPKIKRQFQRQLLDIQKSDYYRLQYLYQNGGIYSDLDNVINYECLLKALQPYKNQDKIVVMYDPVFNRNKSSEVMNSLIFSPRPYMPAIKKIMDSVDQSKQKINWFAGLKFLNQFQQIIEVNLDDCVKHYKDWSWYADYGKVKRKQYKPHDQFSQKLVTKKQILIQNEILKNSNKEQNDKTQDVLKQIDTQLAKKQEQLSKLNIQLQKKQKQLNNRNLQIKETIQNIERVKMTISNKKQYLQKLTSQLVKSEQQKQRNKLQLQLKQKTDLLSQKSSQIKIKDRKMQQVSIQYRTLRQQYRSKNSQLQLIRDISRGKKQIKTLQNEQIQTVSRLQKQKNQMKNIKQRSEQILTNTKSSDIQVKILLSMLIIIVLVFIVKRFRRYQRYNNEKMFKNSSNKHKSNKSNKSNKSGDNKNYHIKLNQKDQTIISSNTQTYYQKTSTTHQHKHFTRNSQSQFSEEQQGIEEQ